MANIGIASTTSSITVITTGISQGMEHHWGENHSLPSATRTATVVPTHMCACTKQISEVGAVMRFLIWGSALQ